MKSIPTHDRVLLSLNAQRNLLLQQVKGIEAAMEAYSRVESGAQKTKHMSAATRRKLSIAAKARWAKRKKG